MFFQILITFLLGGTLLMIILSLVNMIVIGPSIYFKQIKSLFRFTVDKSFFISHKVNAKWGSNVIPISSGYYFFIDVRSDTRVIMIKLTDKYFDFFTIVFIDKIKGEWVYDTISSSINSCPVIGILRHIAKIKMKSDRVNNNPIQIKDSGEIDTFINSELVQISRDKKIKTILK